MTEHTTPDRPGEPAELHFPPDVRTADGRSRRVGVEIEFAGVRERPAAELVAIHFGGRPVRDHAYRFRVPTDLGEFVVELDTQFAHPGEKKAAGDDGLDRLIDSMGVGAAELIGDLSTGFVPCEVVAPPLEIAELPRLDALLKDLIEAGARGTDEHPIYAFGLHYNPEVVATTVEHILPVLKSFLLLADRLRRLTLQDTMRTLLPFARPFPRDYVLLVLDPDYRPSLEAFISDYLQYNPTRNRELDCLPLFAHIDRDRVLQAVNDPRVTPRPTFHYRLPDARFRDVADPVVAEWNRWVQVERLAADTARLDAMAAAYRENFGRLIPGNWAEMTERWLSGL